MICVLTGGTGGAKFVDGLRQVMPHEEITLIVNTGDGPAFQTGLDLVAQQHDPAALRTHARRTRDAALRLTASRGWR